MLGAYITFTLIISRPKALIIRDLQRDSSTFHTRTVSTCQLSTELAPRMVDLIEKGTYILYNVYHISYIVGNVFWIGFHSTTNLGEWFVSQMASFHIQIETMMVYLFLSPFEKFRKPMAMTLSLLKVTPERRGKRVFNCPSLISFYS